MLLQRQMRDLGNVVDDHLDMTPMVDVVFQLLTFLLLTYTPTSSAEVEIPVAKHGVGVEQDQAYLITIARPEMPGAPVRVFGGDLTDPDRQLNTPEAVQKAVSDALAQGMRHVILQADGGVSHGEVLRIAAAASEVEGITLHLGVREPE